MINFLSGTYEDNSLKLSNGVGYEVSHPYDELAGPVALHIITIVREFDIKLYGFKSMDEKLLFKSLLNVNKIGPALALNMFKSLTFPILYQALAEKDSSKLSSIKGLGKNIIEQLFLSFKLPKLINAPEYTVASSNSTFDDQIDLLTSLGYSRREVEPILENNFINLSKSLDKNLPEFEQELIKLTLESLRRE